MRHAVIPSDPINSKRLPLWDCTSASYSTSRLLRVLAALALLTPSLSLLHLSLLVFNDACSSHCSTALYDRCNLCCALRRQHFTWHMRGDCNGVKLTRCSDPKLPVPQFHATPPQRRNSHITPFSICTPAPAAARAVLEATAFQVAEVLTAMKSDARAALKALRVDGGMTANGLLMQFQVKP